MTPVWRTLWQDRIVRLALLGVPLLALPYFVPLVAAERTELYCNFVAPGALLALALAAWHYRRGAAETRAERRFFDLGGGALSLWLLQRLLRVLTWRTASPASLLAQDALLVAFYACLVIAVHLRPDRGDGPLALGPRRFLGIAGTLIFVLGLLAYFSLIPFVFNPPLLLTAVPSMVLVVVLDILLVFRFARARQSTSRPRWRAIYGWLLVTTALWLLTDLVEALISGRVLHRIPPGTPAELLWWLPFLTLVVAARVREHPFPPGPEPAADEEVSPRAIGVEEAWGDALVAYAAAFPLLHYLLSTLGLLDPATRSARESLALTVLVLLAGLAVAYQKLLLAENRRLEAVRLRAAHAEHLAYHDTLTGLPNRRLLLDRLRSRAGPGPARRRASSPSSSSTSTASRSSTTRSATPSGDEVLQGVAEPPQGRMRARATPSRAWAATSSRSCSATCADAEDAVARSPKLIQPRCASRSTSRPRDLRHRQHRHRHLPQRRHGRRDAAQELGHRHVPGQAAGPRQLPASSRPP